MTSVEVDAVTYNRAIRQNWNEYKLWLIDNGFDEPDRRVNMQTFKLILIFPNKRQAACFKLRWL